MDIEREIAASLTDPMACETYQREGLQPSFFADKACRGAFVAGMGYWRDHGMMREAPSLQVMLDLVPDYADMTSMTSGAAPSYLADRLRGMYAKRQAESTLRDMLPSMAESPVDVVSGIRDAFSVISSLCQRGGQCIEYGADMQAYRAMSDSRDSVEGAPYPWPEMQEWTGGIKPGEIAVLVGPSGLGKTLVACKTALEAVRSGWDVYFATLELEPLDIARRIEFMEANRESMAVNVYDWVHGNRTPAMVEALHQAQDRVAGMPGRLVIDQPRVEDRTPSALVQSCKMHGCRFLIVDQLQFVTKPQRESLAEATGMCMQDFKRQLMTPADGMRIPMLLLHQMNRVGVKAQQQTGKIGSMSDIAHSSWVEQLSDVVWGIGRSQEEEYAGVMNIATLKHRSFGGVGWRLTWDVTDTFQIDVMHDPTGAPVRLEEW